ncbi:hypothetical protein RhiirA1_520540 [Rhizophagus irregularis]|uniref:Uncharacterized protein n=1 Tax=Rhizophagus irregularis TaxID=588596 RepID=A0A2N0SKQ0_9GLOM|nr:hypothetical protein RhiirA1_520540 [Rhizophagus irregularis]
MESRSSNKNKEIYLLQCCCGSDMSLKKSNSEAKARKSRQMYKFAFAWIKKNNNNYISIFGYLKHVEDCQRCLPYQPPPLHLNETIKRMAQNLLQLHVNPSHILDDNMGYVAKHLNGKVIINNERFLLSNQDLINIRNSMTKEVWGLDKRKAEEINIDEFFGSNRIPIGYLFSAAGGAQRASSSYNHLILKELILHYKDKLEQERGCEFVPKQSWENKLKFVLGHHGGHEIVAYRKEIYQFLKNITEKLKTVTESTNINRVIIDTEYFLKLLIIKGVLDFVYYIRDYWCGDLASGWCTYGRIIAANLLQVPLEKIPTTNNHLESFNSELKRNLKHELQIQLKERYKSYVPFLPEERIQLEYHYRQLVYYTPDPNRDEAAKRICNEKKIIQVEFNDPLHNPQDALHSHETPLLPSQQQEESLHNSEPTLTPPNDPEKTILPINSSLNHHAAIWKQEHITLATNLLANLNEIDFITKGIKRLSDNIPDGIEENTKCLNIEMKSILEKMSEMKTLES